MNLPEILDFTIFGVPAKGPLLFCFKAILIYIFVRLAVYLTKFLFQHSMAKKHIRLLNNTNVGFIRRIIIYAIYIIGFTAFIALIPGLEKISNSILASAGILAMAVGLASKEALSNIVAGFFIIFTKQFRVGDKIKIDSTIDGTVKEITLRHTVLRNSENKEIIVPNSKINTSTIINSTKGEKAKCCFIEIGVSYSVNLDHAIKIMRDEIMKHPLLIDRRSEADKQKGVPQVIIRVINLGDSAITLKAWAWAANSGDVFILKCDLLKAVKERFDAESIEIPYPYFNHVIINQ